MTMTAEAARLNADAIKRIIAQAEREGRWIFCRWRAMWFEPDVLSQLLGDGRGGLALLPAYWFELRDEAEYIFGVRDLADRAVADYLDAILRVESGT